jgi:hypothetical protein
LKPGSASRSSCLSYLPTMPLVPWSTKPVGTCFLTVPRGANSRPFIIHLLQAHGFSWSFKDVFLSLENPGDLFNHLQAQDNSDFATFQSCSS